MQLDRRTLNLIAAVLCGIGSLATFLTARGDRAARLSGLLGTIGSAAWAASAYDDILEARAQLDTA